MARSQTGDEMYICTLLFFLWTASSIGGDKVAGMGGRRSRGGPRLNVGFLLYLLY